MTAFEEAQTRWAGAVRVTLIVAGLALILGAAALVLALVR